MSCECSRSVEESLVAVRSRVTREKSKLLGQLERFREDVRGGFYRLVANHLFKAGVYYAALDTGLSKNLDAGDVLGSLRRRLTGKSRVLRAFVDRNDALMEEQAGFVVVEDLLRGIVKHGEEAVGLLQGNGDREVALAEKFLEKVERLESYLSSWREGIAGDVEYLKIVDMHD